MQESRLVQGAGRRRGRAGSGERVHRARLPSGAPGESPPREIKV